MKQELPTSLEQDPVLSALHKTLTRNKVALEQLILENGASHIEMYRYYVGKLWGINFAIAELLNEVKKYDKQED